MMSCSDVTILSVSKLGNISITLGKKCITLFALLLPFVHKDIKKVVYIMLANEYVTFFEIKKTMSKLIKKMNS